MNWSKPASAEPSPSPFGPPAPPPRPWYRRRAVVLPVAGLSLLLVGNLSAQGQDTPTVPTQTVSSASVESAQVLAAAAARDRAAAQEERVAAEAAASAAAEARRQAAADLAEARTLAEQAATDRAAAEAAQADRAAAVPPSPAPVQGFVGGQPAAPAEPAQSEPAQSEPATDPRFPTCAKAKAAGYGNYREGEDPEYDWYRDADHDGVVCE